MNVICWGIAGLISSDPIDRWTVVRLFISLQHFVVGSLLLARSPVGVSGNTRQLFAALPSLIICGIAFKHSPAPHGWPWYAQTAFACATTFGVVSLLFLGKNFAIFPALREISTNGPYQWVRHPLYLAELLMVLATVWAGPNPWTLVVLGTLIPSLYWRIRAEEKLLRADTTYLNYCDSVRWRLVPCVW